ncbi:MAG TPA: TRAM domain-containing protein [Nitrososphaera sp.]|nr:TRAM domain-containing protein [Nitrososphaera sp.]
MEGNASSGVGDYDGGQGGARRRSGRNRFSGPKPFRLSPVIVGDEYDVKIESKSKKGDSGVARVQGLVTFVAGTNVGDNVRIRITRVGDGYAAAEVVGETASTDARGAAGK